MLDNNKPKLTILTHSLGKGGAEKVISLLLPKLVKDFEVTLFLIIDLIKYDVPKEVHIVKAVNKEKLTKMEKLLFFPNRRQRFYNFLKTNSQDVVLSFLTRPNLINSSLKSKFPETRVILNERSFPSLTYNRGKVYLAFFKYLISKYYNQADLILSNSKYIKEDLENEFSINNRQQVIYNPIIYPDFRKTNYNLKETIEIVNVGSLKAVKNQSLIIQSLQDFPMKVCLNIYGSDGDHYGGKMSDTLLAEAEKVSVDLKLHGLKNNIYRRIIEYDIFVLSSDREGFPNALLEACACGMPIISTNCMSGPLEILNEGKQISINTAQFAIAKCGILVNPNDSIGMTMAIKYLVNNKDAREKLANNARLRAKNFALDKIYDQYFNALYSM